LDDFAAEKFDFFYYSELLPAEKTISSSIFQLKFSLTNEILRRVLLFLSLVKSASTESVARLPLNVSSRIAGNCGGKNFRIVSTSVFG
jgi:hypothetical protein